MPSDPLEQYRKYLNKDPNDGDQYVLIDAKWFENWKKFLQSNESENEKVSPGPIDFTLITDPTTKDHGDDVQLRPDALEGNDFTFIPFEMYEILEKEYTKVGHPIIRKAIPRVSDGFDFIIETFYVPLRVCRSRNETKEAKPLYLSRRTTISQLKDRVCQMLNRIVDHYHRLVVSTDDKGTNWEPIEEQSNAVLADLSIVRNAFITYESESATAASSRAVVSYQYPTNTRYTPGLCGLSNLGNTCFMNSALQCLSNVPELTQFFRSESYKEQINKVNPLGTKGDIALAYGELISNMWSGTTNYYAPKALKNSVARYAPQFSGYNQQDSQEFMSFLLDGLHEDLNLVKEKPYVEKKDDDGVKSDKQLADEQWDLYLQRNKSKIQEIFHGQIKSVVTCRECGKTGRTFDPTCFLSLPLPEKKKIRKFKIEFVRLDGKISIHQVKIHEQERMKNLVQAFCDRFKAKTLVATPMEIDQANGKDDDVQEDDDKEEEEEQFTFEEGYTGPLPQYEYILPAEVYNHRIHTQYRDDATLTSILERDRIVFYQVPNSLKQDKSDTILMPCVFRSADTYRANFGLPIYLTIPRVGCKGNDIYRALEENIEKFLPLAEVEKNARPLYTPNLIMNSNYNQQTRALVSMLDDTIDFNRSNTTLTVDVASSVVEKYEELEKKRNPPEERPYSASNYNNYNNYNNEKDKKQATLNDCLKLFTKNEKLSDDDRWYCPNCKKLQPATKKIDLWRLPQVLIIQLKRFNYTRYYRDKIDVLVDCPTTSLDLSNYVIPNDEKTNAKYDLIAVSNHMGGLGGGHYTAYAKNDDDKRWHSFDDGYVGDALENSVVSRAAYVLIYQRQQQQQQQPVQTESARPASARKGSAKTALNNPDDRIAVRLSERLRNNSFPNIGTTCMKDAPPASTKEPYSCGPGEKDFSSSGDSQYYNRYAQCTECYTRTLQICPTDSFSKPPTRTTKSGIVLYDLNDVPLNDYLLKSHHAFTDNRYGGITFGDPIEDDYLNRSHALVWFNNKGYHALPSYLNVMNNLILRSKTSDPVEAEKFGISTYSHPFTLNSDLLSQQSLEQRISDFGVAITVLCAYSFVPAAVILYLVREYITQEKRLIFISGVKPIVYWLSTLVWDLIYYIILVGLTMVLIKIFNVSSFNSRALTTQAIVALLFLYGWSSIPIVYCLIRLFKDTGTAFMAAFCLWMFSGIITCIADLMLTLYAWAPGVTRVQEVLSRLFLLFPPYCLGSGLVHLMRNEIMADFGRTVDADLYVNPFTISLTGDRMIAMALLGCVALIITLVLDLDLRLPNCFHKIPSPDTLMDRDVLEERQRVLHTNENNNQDLLEVKNLTKLFRRATGQSLLAVDHLCFGISKGQCFGLLGINGAGKTTTFKMITGDVHPTSGDCLLYEKQIRHQARENPGSVGYCPQFDAVDGYLTSREALMCYAKLIGIADREHVVNTTLRKFHMDSFANRVIRTYSGGMRRKLSVAVAMLGQPDLILLDEPTNGMDPGNRRVVWNNLIKAKKDDQAILLTSHSMAECDVLCSRLAIMVNGQFKCLGTPQHLKHRFGTGYYLKLRLEDEESIQIASNIMQQSLPDSLMTERHGTRLEYNIPKSYSLSKIFGFIERNKSLMNVIDYSLSQTTLEHVFLRFASKQRDNSLANLEDVIIDDTASIASSTVQSFIQTTDKANNTLTHIAPDNTSQTAADLQELPAVTSCHDLILNVDPPPSSNSSVSSPQDDHIFRI